MVFNSWKGTTGSHRHVKTKAIEPQRIELWEEPREWGSGLFFSQDTRGDLGSS